MSVQTRHAGMSVYTLTMEGTTVLAVYMLAMILAPVPLMIAVRSTSRTSPGGVYVEMGASPAGDGAAARGPAAAGADNAARRTTSHRAMQPDTGGVARTWGSAVGCADASCSPSAPALGHGHVLPGATPAAAWPDLLSTLPLRRPQEEASVARERPVPAPAVEMYSAQSAFPPPIPVAGSALPVAGSASTPMADGSEMWWSWPNRRRVRRSAVQLSAREQAKRRQHIDLLSVALATLPLGEDSGSDDSRRSHASSVAVRVSDLGLEQLQAALKHARVRPSRVALHHVLTVWRAMSAFVGTPSVTRDVFFAWLAWTLMLALRPEVQSLPT